MTSTNTSMTAWDEDRAANVRAMAMDRDDDTLGPCGCTDYHMADCPTRTGYADAYVDAGDLADRYYDEDDR